MSRYLLNRIGSFRLTRQPQSSFVSSLRLQTRSFAVEAPRKPIPEAKDGMTTESFLTAIGRDAVSKVKVTEWEELWSLNGYALKNAGLAVRDRRYILWCMEKFRQGFDPKEFVYPPTPKKKIRGHGPSIQFGKRIRSRRHR